MNAKINHVIFLVWVDTEGWGNSARKIGRAALWTDPANYKKRKKYYQNQAKAYAKSQGLTVHYEHYEGKWTDSTFIECKRSAERWAMVNLANKETVGAC